MDFANNPAYKEVFHSKVHDVRFYMPTDMATGYHLSRYVAAGAQNIYASSGATKETLETIMSKMIELCNDEKNLKTLRTDIAILANNIKYRLKYPVDEDCSLRMGAIYCFIDGEDPNNSDDYFTRKKVQLAKGDGQNIKADPELYAFFLSMGVELTPVYKELLDTLNSSNYFQNRGVQLQSLTPQ